VPCTAYIGENGAGHYVKMVHNGIEYGDMQMICEAYALMKGLLGLKPAEMSAIFTEWNKGILDSFLIEITRTSSAEGSRDEEALRRHRPRHRRPEGHGQVDLDQRPRHGRAGPDDRRGRLRALPLRHQGGARGRLEDPEGPSKKYRGSRKALVAAIHDALYCSKICSYAQGFQLMREAQKEYGGS
jgi:6-phosphogluconate dehydrogenase